MGKTITMNLLVGCLISLIIQSPAVAATHVKFTLVRNYLIVTTVTIPEAGACEFLLDTGSNTTVLDKGFVHQLGLQPIDRVQLVTTAGTKIVKRAKLAQLSLGERTARNLEVIFTDLREVRAVLPKVKGILGQNFLSQFNYLIDYSNHRIQFVNEPDARWCGAQFPFSNVEGKMLLQIKSNLHFMLDSAIADLLLFDADQKKHDLGRFDELSRPMKLQSALGNQEVWQATIRAFQVGAILFKNLPITFLPQSPLDQGRIEDGLLPMSLFESIYVNNHQNYVLFNPLTKTTAVNQ